MMPLLPTNKQVLNQAEITKSLTSNLNKQIYSDKSASTTPNATQLISKGENSEATKLATSQNDNIQIPNSIRQALTEITHSFSKQQSLTNLLTTFNKQQALLEQKVIIKYQNQTILNQILPNQLSSNQTIDDDLFTHLFNAGIKLDITLDPRLLSEQLHTAILYYNTALNNKNNQNDLNKSTWQEKLIALLVAANTTKNTDTNLLELGNKWLTRANHNSFMQQLQINSGNAVLLQDIPIFANQEWHGAHLEIEKDQSNNNEALASWNTLIQFSLTDEITITAKAILNAHQELSVFIWTDHPATTYLLDQHKDKLNKSLANLGLLIQPIFVMTGKPSMGKDEQKPHSLSGSINLST